MKPNTAIHPVRRPARRRAFTLVEILVVIVVIAILVSILGVALSRAMSSSRSSLAVRQVQSIVQAIEAFHADFGYHPPLLINPPGAPEVGGFNQFVVPEAYRRGNPLAYEADLEAARWHSTVSLPTYLVGIGDVNCDGIVTYDDPATPNIVEPNYDTGVDGPGIRNPGPDRSWGGAANRQNQIAGRVPVPTGRVFGPYLDIGRLGSDLLFRRADRNAEGGGFNDDMYEFRDPFNNPIRYYRHWPTRNSAGDLAIGMPPVELRSPDSLAAHEEGDVARATDIDRALLSAPYAVLAAGEQSFVTDQVTNDFGETVTRTVPPFGDRVRNSAGALITLQTDTFNEFDPTALPAQHSEIILEQLRKFLASNARGGI